MKPANAAAAQTFVVRHQGPSAEGHRVFAGAFARNRAGEYARGIAMALAGEPVLLTIADCSRFDRHQEGALVLSSYLWTPGSGWVHQRGTTIKGLAFEPMACAAE